MDDKHRSGRPSTTDDGVLDDLIRSDPRLTTREVGDLFGCSHTTVENHLHSLGKIQKLGVWVPHELSPANKDNRVSVCTSLITRQQNAPFLDRLITGDEKWVLYINVRRKKQWLDRAERPLSDAKADLHQKKIMICVWWDMRGIVHWERLDDNATVNSELYCHQLQRVQDALVQKRPAMVNRKGVILLHDNARPHVAKMTRQKIHELGWEVLPHPPYSPDMAPTDYHLFRSLQDHLAEKRFKDDNDIETDIEKFFMSKSEDFYKGGILKLQQRWGMIVDQDGEYIID